jgi:hypothetical protein
MIAQKDLVAEALKSLAVPGNSYPELSDLVPKKPGLYALHAEPGVWAALGWAERANGLPLYVGKAERSLNSRDVNTHFATGATGWSTVRRSLAVLLRASLKLEAVPRNDTVPVRPANYGIEPGGDERLSRWMRDNLTLSYWVAPGGVRLKPLEENVIDGWQPPLNLDKVRVPSRLLKRGRKAMADEVRVMTGLAIKPLR